MMIISAQSGNNGVALEIMYFEMIHNIMELYNNYNDIFTPFIMIDHFSNVRRWNFYKA